MTQLDEHATARAIGRHLLADLYGIDPRSLKRERWLLEMLVEALAAAGFTVLGTNLHKFTEGGCGVTGVVMLSESHAAFHTYPEFGYMALDVFSCGRQDPHQVLDAITRQLQPTVCKSDMHVRGANR